MQPLGARTERTSTGRKVACGSCLDELKSRGSARLPDDIGPRLQAHGRLGHQYPIRELDVAQELDAKRAIAQGTRVALAL